MERLLFGFLSGALICALYEDRIKRRLAFERTRAEIRNINAVARETA
jgi:hypothetical protein